MIRTKSTDARHIFVGYYLDLARVYHSIGDKLHAAKCAANAHKLLDALVTEDADQREEDDDDRG